MVYTFWVDESSQKMSMPWKERFIAEERVRFGLRRKVCGLALLCVAFRHALPETGESRIVAEIRVEDRFELHEGQ